MAIVKRWNKPKKPRSNLTLNRLSDLITTIFAFGITDYVTAQRMTLKEFNIRQQARDMLMFRRRKSVLTSFQIRQAQASKKDEDIF